MQTTTGQIGRTHRETTSLQKNMGPDQAVQPASRGGRPAPRGERCHTGVTLRGRAVAAAQNYEHRALFQGGMVPMLKISVLLVATICLVVSVAVPALAYTDSYDLTSTALGIAEGNYGFSYFVSPDLTLTAITKMTDGPGSGVAGTIYFHNKEGAGVQDELAGGSKEISGGGPCQDEALVFTFGTPPYADSPTLLLNKFKPDKDDVELVVSLVGGSTVYVPIATVDLKAVKVGKESYTLAFADLPELAGKEPLTSFYVRTWEGHVYVSGLHDVAPTPEPATLVLLGLSLGGVGLLRRRRAA